MFCSTIIPTVGRPSLIRAVESVLHQSLTDDFEIIVVNDSGKSLPVESWQTHDRVQVVTTQKRERSVSRNIGAALARGRYLHFLDDDDWLLPDALPRLHEFAQQQQAAWLYGGTQLVDRQDNPLIQIRPDMNGNCFIQAMAGEWVPLQASLIRAKAFFAVEGFNPLLAGPEDNDLLRRVALHYELAGIPDLVATVEWRGDVSTTNYDRHPQQSRWAREQILNAPNSFARMRVSASSPYWYGRIPRAYLTSMVWNMRRHRFLTALSRGGFTIAALLRAGHYLATPTFWQAIAKSHTSEAFQRGEAEAKATSFTGANGT